MQVLLRVMVRRIVVMARYVSRQRSRCLLRQPPLPSLISVLIEPGPTDAIRSTLPEDTPNTPNTPTPHPDVGRASIRGMFLKVGWGGTGGGISERAAPSEPPLYAETRRSSDPLSSDSGRTYDSDRRGVTG